MLLVFVYINWTYFPQIYVWARKIYNKLTSSTRLGNQPIYARRVLHSARYTSSRTGGGMHTNDILYEAALSVRFFFFQYQRCYWSFVSFYIINRAVDSHSILTIHSSLILITFTSICLPSLQPTFAIILSVKTSISFSPIKI